VKECNIQKGHVRIACDGLSTLKQAQSRQPIGPDTPHYDLIGAIRNIRQATPVRFSFEHVRGHQDSGITMVLTQTTWMNIKMDALAKAMISQNTRPLRYYLEGKPWTCYTEGHHLVKQVTAALRRHINTITIEAHCAKKQHYKRGNAAMVDHEMAGCAIRGLPKAQQRWVAKSAACFLPYGINMKRWKLQQEDCCPRCHQPAETKAHLTQCQATEAIQTWTMAIDNLDQWLRSIQMAPEIRKEIIKGLQTRQKTNQQTRPHPPQKQLRNKPN